MIFPSSPRAQAQAFQVLPYLKFYFRQASKKGSIPFSKLWFDGICEYL